MNTRNKQKIRHEIKRLFNSIANNRSREHYDVLDSSKQHRNYRDAILICISMSAGILLGVGATTLFREYNSMQQYSLPTPDIEELKPVNEDSIKAVKISPANTPD
ncbi:MAG: hypothetical protein JXA04_03920 [Gammaproteobacteria bacterium]|nr:hypothetical protein [Gammaproteobacteria bacterium]